ncbi:hypothetical protein [Pediococcus pentosaceus]|jgi:uncharacterized membrane protein YccF (DUF307 family)|nr:hypothetical protein [Pediococcus pentosaceus]
MSKGCIWLLLIIGSWLAVTTVIWLAADAITFLGTLLLSTF